MAYKRLSKEEKERQHRRHRRQLLGGVLCVLILLGVVSVISAGVRLGGKLFDDTKEKQQYEKLLAPVVMLDPVPFDSLETADQNMLLQAAIWETIYTEDISQYERDDAGALILPAVDIDKNAARLFGPSYALEHHTFDANGMQFVYDEEKSGYIIPITGTTSAYTPKVVKIKKSVKEKRVTVGYVAPATGFSLDGNNTEQGEPSFYYDYIFTRQGDGYYLAAITTSDMKSADSSSVSSSAVSSAPDMTAELQQQADSMAAASSDVDSTSASTGSSAVSGS